MKLRSWSWIVSLLCSKRTSCKAIEERIRVLERFQINSVDAIFGTLCKRWTLRICRFVRTHYSSRFLQLKVVATESRHEMASYFSAVSSHWKGKFWFQTISFIGTCLICRMTRNSKGVWKNVQGGFKRLRAVPGQNALENHVALVSAGQGERRWNSSDVMPTKGMKTTRGIVEYVLVAERNKTQRPNAEGGLRTVNEQGTCVLFKKKLLRYNGFKWWLIGLQMKSRMNRLIRHLWNKVERWMEL